jgi:pantothenate kinase-related protein Tda10
MAGFGITKPSLTFLYEIVVPFTQYLSAQAAAANGTYLVGIGGGPGVGKTTQSKILAACLPMMTSERPRCLSVSLDDFYFSTEERLRRGHKWRTLPGSHDTERLCAFVAALDNKGQDLTIPRYDLGKDRPLPDEVQDDIPDICIFDGAMVGATCPGYDSLARRFDFLIYLDAPIAQLQQWRYGRERKLRETSKGTAGFTEDQMLAFWDEALRPSITQWVAPNAKVADIVLEIGENRDLLGVRRPQTPPRAEAMTT